MGQDGPLSQVAGHDLNYISVTGALHAMGRVGQPPTPPLNVLGDYAGGSLYLPSGFAGILEARGSGRGQVVDAAMVDGVASIMTVTMGLHAAGMLDKARGTNLLDTGAPFYEVYACADGKYVSVGPIEESSTGCCSNSSGCRTIRSCRRRWTARNGLQRSRYSPRNSASARATSGHCCSALSTFAWRPCSTSTKRRTIRT